MPAALAHEWRRLTRAATAVALLTAPAFFLVLYDTNNLSLFWALIITVIAVLLFRGLVEVVARKFIPSPSLYGAEAKLKEEDIVARRRYWYWRTKYRRLPVYIVAIVLLLALCQLLFAFAGDQRAVLPSVRWTAADLPAGHAPAAGAGLHPAAAAVLRQLRDLLRPVPVLRGPPDPRL